MKINKHIKIFTFSFLGFVILCLVIYFSQQKKYDDLIKHGKYTISIGDKIRKDRIGWTFVFNYKVGNHIYEGLNSATGIKEEFAIDGIYFVVFDPNKPKRNFLTRCRGLAVRDCSIT